MPDDTKPSEPAPPEPGANDKAAPESPPQTAPEIKTGEAATAGAASEAAAPEAEGETLRHEIDGLKDQLFRALAEMDNLRKRTDRDKADTAKFAIAKFAQDIVNVGDSFQLAINAVPADAADKDPALKSFLEGVTIAERAFLAALERHGIKQINPAGEPFNPYQHHAASEEQDASVTAGTITKVYQVGYVLEERVLRPAMVVVARGGKKPAPEEAIKPANENTAPASENGAAPSPDATVPKGQAEEKAG